MRNFPNLPRAPIVEAIIDLRVQQNADFDPKSIDRIHGQISVDYPVAQPRFRLQSEIKLEQGEIARSSASQETDGFAYTSSDQKKIIQAHNAGFTFSWLKPYTNWDDLYNEAKKIWGIYCECTRPASITRVATRFINRLELPSPMRDFADYLTAVPQIPPRIPQTLVSFLSRVVIPETNLGALAVITQHTDTSTDPGILPVILDIDVFKEDRFDGDGIEAWEVLNRFREVKNGIFFESLTEKLVERYQ